MAHQAVATLGRAIQLHPVLVYLFGFLAPIAAAYWVFVLLPYRRGQTHALLSPRHVSQPAVPGVLERYAAWEWAMQSRLTPFGRWLFAELERRDLTLAEVAGRSGLEVDALLPVLYTDRPPGTDPEIIRRLAALLGAGEHQVDRLLQAELAAGAERNRPL